MATPLAPPRTVVATPVAPVVMAPPANEQPVVASTVARRTMTRHLYPDAIVAGAVGLVILVVGLLAMVRAGLGGDLREPVVQVLGFSHTAILAIIEVGLGAALLIAGATASRSGALFLGTAAAVAGFIGAVQTKSFVTSLALEASLAWWVCVAGVAVALMALVVPRWYTRSTQVRAA